VSFRILRRDQNQFLIICKKIKDARDHLSAARVYFEADDIVILALNGLPSNYNTFRCMIRGRDNTLSFKDFRSQLLA